MDSRVGKEESFRFVSFRFRDIMSAGTRPLLPWPRTGLSPPSPSNPTFKTIVSCSIPASSGRFDGKLGAAVNDVSINSWRGGGGSQGVSDDGQLQEDDQQRP